MEENENMHMRKIRQSKLLCIDTKLRQDVETRFLNAGGLWAVGSLGFPGDLLKREERCLQKMEGSWMLQDERNASQGQAF